MGESNSKKEISKETNSQEVEVVNPEDELHQHLNLHKNPHTLGWITIFVIFGLLGVWAVLADIETSVQASGKVITKGYKKAVQHPMGGIVKELMVKEGDEVQKNQPLLKLDSVSVESQLNSTIIQYDDLLVKKARLEAESNLSHNADFDSIKPLIIEKSKAKELITKEEALLKSNLKQLQLKKALLADKNKILKTQNRGLESKIESNKRILESYENELKKWQKLYERNMTDELKLLDRERKIEQIKADIATAKSRIEENLANIEANKNQLRLEEVTFIDKARQELKDVTSKIGSYYQKILSLTNEKNNLVIKAPDSGTVTEMSIHTEGEVVTPRKPIAYIVPHKNKLVLEMFIEPTDIDKVHIGQLADIQFPSYVDPAALPIEANVTYVSADSMTPEGSKQSFYKILLEITPKGMEAIKKNNFNIVAGMPASAFIKAGKRSFMGYILLPLQSLVKGAFRAN